MAGGGSIGKSASLAWFCGAPVGVGTVTICEEVELSEMSEGTVGIEDTTDAVLDCQ